MSSMPWVKLYTEMLDDPKIGRLNDAIKWRFVSLILLAGECDQEGALVAGGLPMSIDDIAWRLRITREQCETEFEPLIECGVLDNDAGVFILPKFRERQGRPQSEKRAMWRERKERQRDAVENSESVTRESRENHAPRVEKSREDISPDGESAEEKKPRKKSERQIAVDELENRFATISGLQKPSREKSKAGAAVRWWTPLGEMWELCGKDTERAWKLIEASYRKLSGEKMTIAAPQSVLNTAIALHAQNNGSKSIKLTGVVHA